MELCWLSHDNVGQTGGNISTTYKEHLRSSRTNNSKSGLAQHLIDNSHAVGSTENRMKMLRISKAGPYLDILENFLFLEEIK
jgi:hypothetical protein